MSLGASTSSLTLQIAPAVPEIQGMYYPNRSLFYFPWI